MVDVPLAGVVDLAAVLAGQYYTVARRIRESLGVSTFRRERLGDDVIHRRRHDVTHRPTSGGAPQGRQRGEARCRHRSRPFISLVLGMTDMRSRYRRLRHRVQVQGLGVLQGPSASSEGGCGTHALTARGPRSSLGDLHATVAAAAAALPWQPNSTTRWVSRGGASPPTVTDWG